LTTIRNGRLRHFEPSSHGKSKDNVPIPPTMNDKYIDLMALVLGHRSEKTPTGYEKVIIKTENDDSNPSLADVMDIKLR
jgi:RAB protein geranylgeranyltransferase component A